MFPENGGVYNKYSECKRTHTIGFFLPNKGCSLSKVNVHLERFMFTLQSEYSQLGEPVFTFEYSFLCKRNFLNMEANTTLFGEISLCKVQEKYSMEFIKSIVNTPYNYFEPLHHNCQRLQQAHVTVRNRYMNQSHGGLH